MVFSIILSITTSFIDSLAESFDKPKNN
jgi:hypothetical protein